MGIGEVFSSPKAGTPLRATQHLLLETPYITYLSTLMAEALNRLVTVLNKQIHYLFTWAMETVILPVVVGVILVVNAGRLYYGGWWVEHCCWAYVLSFALGAPWPALCLASIQLTMYYCAHH
ncbi:hypothetical protein Pmani_022733 [Petrolisthes manimaculis]|uniref:Uncharacterized protein n=1 Tax=Petrolisthes manimaculis TaxID=1843537 RepID=A0AAE1PCJ4_9EUCA|nr:hypothetical protein Pmani_022733 [Petrolisthes manimaculis]